MERKAVGSRDTEDSMRMIEDDDPGDGLRDNLEEFIDFSLSTSFYPHPSSLKCDCDAVSVRSKVSGSK